MTRNEADEEWMAAWTSRPKPMSKHDCDKLRALSTKHRLLGAIPLSTHLEDMRQLDMEDPT